MSEEARKDLYETAAAWHGRLDSNVVSAGTRAAFEAWLAADPQHAAAYRLIERQWTQLGEARDDERIRALRCEALAAPSRARYPRVAAAAALAVVLLGASYLAVPVLRESRLMEFAGVSEQRGAFSTAVGEQSTVALPDGSTVVLNTDSRAEVSYSAELRRLRLLRGQAWFQVARNPDRPFVVEAGEQRIVALGTAFEVRIGQDRESVKVALMEGRVRVEPIESALRRFIGETRPAAELLPGESLVVSDSAPMVKLKTDPWKIGRWRHGQIIFDDDTLGSAIEEVNRYSTTQIVLEDESLRALPVSGVFNAGHSQSFLETVTAHYPIEIVERTEKRIILAGRPAG